MSVLEQPDEGMNIEVDVGQPNESMNRHHIAGQTQGRFGMSGGKLAL